MSGKEGYLVGFGPVGLCPEEGIDYLARDVGGGDAKRERKYVRIVPTPRASSRLRIDAERRPNTVHLVGSHCHARPRKTAHHAGVCIARGNGFPHHPADFGPAQTDAEPLDLVPEALQVGLDLVCHGRNLVGAEGNVHRPNPSAGLG
jgi:hypothetical protein